MKTAYFNRFKIEMPDEAVSDIARGGHDNESAVQHYLPSTIFSVDATPDNIRAELKEYGAWDEVELADHARNCVRIVWVAAWNIREDENQNYN